MRDIVVDGLILPEGPRWHDGTLWLSDIRGNRVMRVDASDAASLLTEAIPFPSGIGFLPDGDPTVVAMHERVLYRLTADGPRVHADLTALCTGMLNDMIVDSRGNAWVDTLGTSFFAGVEGATEVAERPTPDGLVHVAPDGTARLAAEGLLSPNGIALMPDERTLISAESGGARLTAFDVEPDGSLTNRRLFADLGSRFPDGICLDAEGAVWVACPLDGEFVRVREGGEVTDVLEVGATALACVLGGSDRRSLFLMVASPHDLDLLHHGRTTGTVERVRVAVPGAGRP